VRVVVAGDHRSTATESSGHSPRETAREDVVARSGRWAESLDAIREYRPDVALLDYRLPELDGR